MRLEMTPHTSTTIQTREFVVSNLEATPVFWDPLMAFLGWRRVDDGFGAVVYQGGNAQVVFSEGEEWDRAVNEDHRLGPFAHLAFELSSLGELRSLGRSVEARTGVEVFGPRSILENGRWLHAIDFRDPNGLDVEIRCPR